MELVNTVNFQRNCAFYKDVKTAVKSLLPGEKKKANTFMYIKSIIALSFVFLPYGLLLSNRFRPPLMLLLAALMGVGFAFTGFSIYHDALHNAFSRHKWVNRLLGMTMDLAGLNSYHWQKRHNQIHHSYTNIHHMDEDINGGGLLVLSPFEKKKWFHRYQHWYFFLIYFTIYFFWVFQADFAFFLSSGLGPSKKIRKPRIEIVKLIVFKTVFFFYTIYIPLRFLHVTIGQFFAGYAVMLATAGFIYGMVFNLAHVVEGVRFELPGQELDNSWAVHQVYSTANFSMQNKWLTWFLGGLNYQVEHHLFPDVSSIHYPAISRIVREYSVKFNIPYNAKGNFATAFSSHIRTLKAIRKWKLQISIDIL